MNIWKNKKDRILNGEYQVPLDDKDFSSSDRQLIKNILSVYPLDMIKNSKVIQIKDKIFIFSKKDANSLKPYQMDTLHELADVKDLKNPVYISIDRDEKKGRLLVD